MQTGNSWGLADLIGYKAQTDTHMDSCLIPRINSQSFTATEKNIAKRHMAPLAHCWCQTIPLRQLLQESRAAEIRPSKSHYLPPDNVYTPLAEKQIPWFISIVMFCVHNERWIVNHHHYFHIRFPLYLQLCLCNWWVPEMFHQWFWTNVVCGCLSQAPMWPKAKLLYCMYFTLHFFLCINLPHTKPLLQPWSC